MVNCDVLGDWKISRPAAEILAVAALALGSSRYRKLGVEMLEYGIAAMEGSTTHNVRWFIAPAKTQNA
jgi:hypothetical protein